MTTNTGLKVVQPYLFFSGNCEEALNFYKSAIGAEITALMRFKDAPEQNPNMPAPPPDKVMHANLKIGQTEVMASDGCSSDGKSNFQGFSLSVAVDSEAEAERIFNALSPGGNVMMPMGKTFFAPKFGMLTDKFGVGWMVIVIPPGGHAPK
ncbi:MAG TPA: VOC family protein [Verrucomicrobiae bacterium]